MLRVESVSKDYDSFRLGPISLDVDDEIVAVLGPSGCGKTTLLSIVAGIVDPDAGTVRLNGDTLTGRPPERRGTAVVFQDGALFPHMTARENVAYAARSAEDVRSLADTLEITDVLDQRAVTLSGGQRQRVALARSLAADPDALLLDEPLSNLDAPIKRRLRDEMRELLTSLSIPVVYVTHDQHEATGIGDRIAVMEDGTVHQIEASAEVFRRPATPFVASFTGNDNVFEASVVDARDGPVLQWGDYRLEAPDRYDVRNVDDVQFCIRPEYVELTDDASATNVVSGRITRRVFEGDGYLVAIQPVGIDGDRELELRVPPPVYDRFDLDARDGIRAVLSTPAIHVLDVS